jgi:acyl-CoA synthetase (AMP-forming)/AMP-acid ligase II
VNVAKYVLAAGRDDDPAIITRAGTLSYAGLRTLVADIVSALLLAGVGEEDRVGLLAENSSFWVACYLAILQIGAIATPFPARLSGEKLRQLSQLTGCHALCLDALRLRQHGAELPSESVVITDADPEELQLPEHLRRITLAEAPAAQLAVAETTAPNALAALMFTSGSTGEPNAVKVSHRNIIANTDSIIEYLGLRQDDRMLVLLPFDYCFGLSLLHTHLRVGGSVVLNNASHLAEDALDDLERFGCTGLAGVPAIYQHLLRRSSLKRRAFPALRHVQQAGGTLAPTLVQELREAVPHARVFVMYGQTEATARLSYLPPERLDDKLGSIGRGIPGVTLEALDATGKPVAPGEIGEIVASGENVALGYWIPDPMKQSFRDGTLYTGDLARVDEDGFFYITGRISEFIKPSGHRISVKEIEDALIELPDVVEVAVVGVPDPVFGEAAKAYVVTREGSDLTEKALVDHSKRRLPAYAVPRAIEFVSELPKNAHNKVLRRALTTTQSAPDLE